MPGVPHEGYDVFFSYNSLEHAAVQTVANALRERGRRVFLDRWYLVPGRPWPEALEHVVGSCRALAIFLGPHGMGRWQQSESYLALDRQTRGRDFPVVPVLLPGADPALGFLSLNTWVDLRKSTDDPVAHRVLDAAWPLMPAMRHDPESLELLVEVPTGYSLSSQVLRKELTQRQWLDRKQRLEECCPAMAGVGGEFRRGHRSQRSSRALLGTSAR